MFVFIVIVTAIGFVNSVATHSCQMSLLININIRWLFSIFLFQMYFLRFFILIRLVVVVCMFFCFSMDGFSETN